MEILKATLPPDHPARRAAPTVILQLIGMGLSFALGVALAQWLGALEYGTYVYALSQVSVLATLSMLGLDRLMVRDISVHRSQRAWGLLRGALHWAHGITLLASLLLAGLVVSLAYLLGLPAQAGLGIVLLLPLVALIRVQQSALRALGRPAASQVPDPILRPLLILAQLAVFSTFAPGSLTASAALAAYIAATGLALATGAVLIDRTLSPEAKVAAPRYRQRAWLAGGFHMLALTGLSIVSGQINLLVLGLFQSLQAVGIYAAAVRGAALVPLLLTMAITAIAPTFASLHAAGERAALQQLATRISRLALLGGLPVAAGLLLMGRWYLGLYGPHFVEGQSALAILSLGQLANIAAGPVTSLLTMTGHERGAIAGLGCSAGANLILSVLLIPRWGMNGAALAATTSLILWNVLLVILVRQRLRISPTIFGARSVRV